jgi:hypothetical protein
VKHPYSEKFSKPTKEIIDHILRFSTSFVTESVRLALVRVRVQGVVAFCANPFESWWLAGKSSTLRLGVEWRRQLCVEDVEIPFLHGDQELERARNTRFRRVRATESVIPYILCGLYCL